MSDIPPFFGRVEVEEFDVWCRKQKKSAALDQCIVFRRSIRSCRNVFLRNRQHQPVVVINVQ